jgi:HSP20 family molecular chaperone IbpA
MPRGEAEKEGDNDDNDDLEETGERLDRVLTYVETGMEGLLFDIRLESLKPLYRVEVTDEEVRVTLDMPRVEKDGVKLRVTARTLTVEATMRRPVKLRVAGPHQRHMQFKKYSKRIRLPEKVLPDEATARLAGGLLTIRLPILHGGTAVDVD